MSPNTTQQYPSTSSHFDHYDSPADLGSYARSMHMHTKKQMDAARRLSISKGNSSVASSSPRTVHGESSRGSVSSTDTQTSSSSSSS